MGFFDFLGHPAFGDKYKPANVRRLNTRHSVIVEPYGREIAGARVLDLASHDGRWAYALSGAGAREVVGIEGRQELIDMYADYPPGETKDRVTLHQGDIFEVLPRMVDDGERFDVVAIFGIFYHIIEHYRLLRLVKATGARLVVVDSEFYTSSERAIRLGAEDTGKPLNAIAREPGEEIAPVGLPSWSAMEHMADALGYDTEWVDWSALGPDHPGLSLSDYQRTGHWKRRGTCALRLRG